jgi:hypothetical protein
VERHHDAVTVMSESRRRARRYCGLGFHFAGMAWADWLPEVLPGIAPRDNAVDAKIR